MKVPPNPSTMPPITTTLNTTKTVPNFCAIGNMTTSTTRTLMDISDFTATIATVHMAWIVRKKKVRKNKMT